jgi:two-component system cell cycle sensor histidine kinase/response regulator CckA
MGTTVTEEQTDDLRAANAQLKAVINIGLELASERDSNRLLHIVCVAARDVFSATYVTLGIVGREQRQVRKFLVCGADATCQARAANWIKTGDATTGILATVVAEPRTVRGANPGGDPASIGLPAAHPEVRAFLAAPIASPTQVFGWICLVANQGKTFTDSDEQLLGALGAQVGRVYENNCFHDITQKRAEELEHEILERKRVEEQLLASIKDNVDLRDAIDQHAIVAVTDPRGRLTFANDRFCELSGYSRQELIGQDHRIINSGHHSKEFIRNLWATIKQGKAWHGELKNKTKDGTFYWLDTTIVPFLNDDGTPRQYMAIRTVVTERKEAELALRDERDRAQRYLDTAEVILLKLDTDCRITLVNRYLCTMLGWGVDELLGCNWIDMCIPVRLRDEYRQKFQELLAGDWPVVENPILTRSGGERLVEWRNGLERDDEGKVVGTFSSGTDITERTRAIEADRAAEERTRFALQSANVGTWDMDYTTGVLQWSNVLEAHYGLQPGTFAGTFPAFIERIHPDDRESVTQSLEQAAASGTDFSALHRTIWPDGSVHWLSCAGRIHLGPEGTPARGVGISLDVTERRTLEEQYQQAQKMEAVGRLAGGVAHDFNNLLTVILGYCELLLADPIPNAARRSDMEEIQKAGERAAGLTRQLLAFSRKQIVEPTLLDVNGIVTGMMEMLKRLIGEDMKIVLGLSPGLALVTADRGQLEQIVMNLAVNARDAMPVGGTLRIETANVEFDENYTSSHIALKRGSYIVLSVTDTGIGMTAEVQARLFEPFFTTKEAGRGTGLGLATVHGIVTQAGGGVTVDSEWGRGTSLKVYLPMASRAQGIVDAPLPVARPAAIGQTILVVEDEGGLRELTRRLLRSQGFNVLVAANAEEALAVVRQNSVIDVVLTDVVMPGASGPQLSRQLFETRPELRIVYMSGYTEDSIVHHGVLDPGIDFLHKPFSSDSLGRKLREVLDR